MRKIAVLIFGLVVSLSLGYSLGICETIEGYFVDQQTTGVGVGLASGFDGIIFAQSFVPATDNIAAIYLPEMGNVVIEIRTDNGGFPSDTILSSSSTRSTLPPLGVDAILFDSPIYVTPGDTYYFVFYPLTGSYYRPGGTQGDYLGQAYYKNLGGDWMVGVPPKGFPSWDDCNDYTFKEYFIGEDIVPIAEAGEDVIASVNETVVLDGSSSYDPDGSIVNYQWVRLPDPSSIGGNIYSGPLSTCETKALGSAEELIQLTVTDEYGAKSTDTMKITNPGVEGPTGPQGEPGIAPEEVAEMQSQILELQQLVQDLQEEIDRILSYPMFRFGYKALYSHYPYIYGSDGDRIE